MKQENSRRIMVISALARSAMERLEPLRAAGFTLEERFDLNGVRDPEKLGRELAGVWGTIAGVEQYSPALFAKLDSLRAITRCGVGYEMIDVNAASQHGIPVMLTPGANEDAVADMALALMLAALRELVPLDKLVRARVWRPKELSGDLAEAVVGVVGLGAIGRGVVRRLKGFGCTVLGVDPGADLDFCREHQVAVRTLDEILPEVDVLTLHVPSLPSTRHLIAAPQLARMKSSAVLINTARGDVVDQDALVAALQSGSIAGAGLDVLREEPAAPDDPILSLENIVLAPHAASFSRGAAYRTLDIVVQNLLAVAAGNVPATALNREQLQGAAKLENAKW